ncbi:hypothetical protein RCH07_001267 [Arthrobacter sp. CG_A4]|nr:hypothetical protein [Arthrobacter sp. CG_A4]
MTVVLGAWDLKQVGDALNGVVPGVVELLGVVGLVGGEFGASSSGSSAGATSTKQGSDGEPPAAAPARRNSSSGQNPCALAPPA